MFINGLDEVLKDLKWLLTLAKKGRSIWMTNFRPLTQHCHWSFYNTSLVPSQVLSFGNFPCVALLVLSIRN